MNKHIIFVIVAVLGVFVEGAPQHRFFPLHISYGNAFEDVPKVIDDAASAPIDNPQPIAEETVNTDAPSIASIDESYTLSPVQEIVTEMPQDIQASNVVDQEQLQFMTNMWEMAARNLALRPDLLQWLSSLTPEMLARPEPKTTEQERVLEVEQPIEPEIAPMEEVIIEDPVVEEQKEILVTHIVESEMPIESEPEIIAEPTIEPAAIFEVQPETIELETISEPEITTEPYIVSEPELIVEQEMIAEPEIIAEQEMIAEPEIIVEQEMIAEPEIIVEQEMIAEPQVIAEPEIIVEQEMIAEPEIIVQQEMIAEPEIIVEKEMIADPEVIIQQYMLAEPEVLIQQEMIAEPEILIQQEMIAEPKILIQQEMIAEPEILIQQEMIAEPEIKLEVTAEENKIKPHLESKQSFTKLKLDRFREQNSKKGKTLLSDAPAEFLRGFQTPTFPSFSYSIRHVPTHNYFQRRR